MSSTIKVPTNAYCTVDDVTGDKLPHRPLTATSRPTFQKGEDIIKRVADEINAILRSLGYSPPLTATADVNLLKEINMLGAAYKIEENALAQVPTASRAVAEGYRTDYEAMIKRLQNGEYSFSDAGLPDGAEVSGNEELESAGTSPDPLFTRVGLDDSKAGDDFGS